MNSEIKPGVQTTELWVGVIVTGVALAVAYGVVTQEEAAKWQDFLVALLAIIPGVSYIIGRNALKITEMITKAKNK